MNLQEMTMGQAVDCCKRGGEHSDSIRCGEILRVAEKMSASHEELCSFELVS